MNRKEARRSRAILDRVTAPEGTLDAQWARMAERMLEAYEGDHLTLIKQLIIAYYAQGDHIAYLQDGISQLAEAMPDVIKIKYSEMGGRLSPSLPH